MSFPLYFDEDQDEKHVVSPLAAAGLDVLTTVAAGRANQKTPDEEQLAFAAQNGRAIVTRNVTDFLALARQWYAEGKHHAGIIVVTPRKQPFEVREALAQMQVSYPDGIQDLIVYI